MASAVLGFAGFVLLMGWFTILGLLGLSVAFNLSKKG